jgi:tripartite-type tricarboxylate transporter receptor subunit TctC
MRIFTRASVLAVSLGLLATLTSLSAAAVYPDHSIRLIVGMPPGGGADYVARLIVPKASEALGASIVVENKAGADGIIAAAQVANARADGYTLAWITNSHVVAPLFHDLTYDPAASFAPIMEVSSAPDVLLVPTAFQANSLRQLIDIARAKPDSVIFGSAGLATPSALEAELMMKVTGIKMTSVPYKGGSDAIVGLLNNSVNMYFATISTALTTLKSGKVKALAVSSLKRSPLLPDVPTVAEVINTPSFEGGTWLGVLAPAKTPKAVVDKLNAAFAAAMRSDEVRERLSGQGWTVIASSPDTLGNVIRSDLDRWAQATKGENLKAAH